MGATSDKSWSKRNSDGRSSHVVAQLELDIPDDTIEVLLEMAGYGIAYWASSLDYRDGKVTIIDREPDDEGEGKTYTCDYADLAEALVNLGTGVFPSAYQDYAARYLSEMLDPNLFAEDASGNIDSDLADHVVQYAVLGELIYG